MHTRCLERFGDRCTHQVARREAPNALLSGEFASWKPRVIHIGPTMAPSPCCRDFERQIPSLLDSCHVPDTESIMGMCLLDPIRINLRTLSQVTPTTSG